MTDQPYPPHWDRSIAVVYRPSLVPYFPYILWCGECCRIINCYETPVGAALFAHRHRDYGGHDVSADADGVLAYVRQRAKRRKR